MTRPEAPHDVVAAATARAAARDRRDWTEADRLRAVIEDAGWTVVDEAVRFRLRPAHPADIEVAGLVRHGWSGTVPPRDSEEIGPGVTIAVVAGGDPESVAIAMEDIVAVQAALAHRGDAAAILVVDGLGRADAPDLNVDASGFELITTGPVVGPAGCLDIVLRRATSERVVILGEPGRCDPAVLDDLVGALDDPNVAIVGLEGLALARLPRIGPAVPGSADAVSLAAAAFRLGEAIEAGDPDLHLRTWIGTGAWLSMALVAGSQPGQSRRVVVLDLGDQAGDRSMGAGRAGDPAIRCDGYRLLRARA